MTWWPLSPRDPVLARDGRPFGGESSARTLDFPYPSVVAGTLRTHIGFAVGDGLRFALSPAQARRIEVAGPLLFRRVKGQLQALLPAPADCVVYPGDSDDTVHRYRLAPERPPEGVRMDHDGAVPYSGALPMQKTDRQAPRFWSQSVFESWMLTPPPTDRASVMSRDNGLTGLIRESRVHVALTPGTRTAEDGMLFSTEGLRFETGPPQDGGQRLGLAVRCTHPHLRSGLCRLGGERRPTLIDEPAELALPTAPSAARRFRVVLLTPAIFAQGSMPSHIAGASVQCAAVGRALPISGWDMAARGPKPVRRLAPAGSVYWVQLDAAQDPAQWLQSVHLRCISDDPQDQLDGFGMAAVGVWS